MSSVLIIGGGAAGMMAAIAAGYNGNEVHLFEKNDRLGKKIFITGKGRCNITNASSIENHFSNIIYNEKFLYSAYNNFSSEDICNMIESTGIETKIERGNRVFPLSDKSSDVIWALDKMMKDIGVNVHLKSEITKIENSNNKVILIDKHNNKFAGDKCIVATGGMSYETTGSTGDGYKFAEEMGHTVKLTITDEKGKVYFKEQGEMLFTHFGISGPLVLSASCYICDKFKEHDFYAYIDLKPALDKETLDKRILKDFNENINKNFNNSLDKLLPKKMIEPIIELCNIDPYIKVNEITKEEREILVENIKNIPLTISGTRGFNEAIITRGGISVKDINPKTMESKIVPNMYFVGEVLDLDAKTGGYNLQIAWSTGYLAGSSIY